MTRLRNNWNELHKVFLAFCFSIGYALGAVCEGIALCFSAVFWFICALLIIGTEAIACLVMYIYNTLIPDTKREDN